MRKLRDVVDTMDLLYSHAAERGLMYRQCEDEALSGRTVRLDGKDLLHFGSCSYLGLELHPAVKEGAIDAVRRYGTQFSASRAAASTPLYGELEGLLAEIMGMPVLVAPSTSLAHASALPLLVDERDAVVLDQQVHHSVSNATHHLLVQGTSVEVIRHNRLDLLEARIRELRQRYRRVWYMADGVYSMFGDLVPMGKLHELLEAYPCLHLYLDDAHGMSWTGRHGRGHVLECLPRHERLVTASSLAKAFGVGGGVLALPDGELFRRVRTVGTSFTFSGPLQPPTLGAAVASARLHLTPELGGLQAALRSRIERWDALCREHGLPTVAPATSPIRFVAVGQPEVAGEVVKRMMEGGVYPTLAIFPAVPLRRAGVRFALNLHLTDADLEYAVKLLAHHLPIELARAGTSLEEVRERFLAADAAPVALSLERSSRVPALEASARPALSLEHHESIHDLDAAEWDRLMGPLGSYDHEGARFLEEAFRDNQEPANNWRFHYYVVREPDGRPVLAAFATETHLKDDLLAPADVSRQIEERRAREPGYMTSRALVLGSMFSEGAHLYLDRERDWQGALGLLLRALDREQARCGATTLVLRDLPGGDAELDACLLGHGFARAAMPESLVLDVDWRSEEEYMARLSAKSRLHQRRKVHPFNGHYEREVLNVHGRVPTAEELAHYHRLYREVAARNLDFNGFLLPERLFDAMLAHPNWELLLLRLKPEHGGEPGGLPVAYMAGYRGQGVYTPAFCGLDYRYVKSHGAYRQLLRTTIAHAHDQGFGRIYLGFGAAHEKTRYGCKPRDQNLYVQTTDAYQMEVLAQLMKVGAKG